MEKLDPTSSEFMVELLTLRPAVQQHATQEEVEVFPLLAKLSSETLVSLGENYTAAKAAAPNHPHPNAPDAPPGSGSRCKSSACICCSGHKGLRWPLLFASC